MGWASAFRSAAVNIPLGDGLKCLLALHRVYADGIDQAEGQLVFRGENRGVATRQEHGANTAAPAPAPIAAPVPQSAAAPIKAPSPVVVAMVAASCP
jgi:hypothetical protein